MLSKIKNIIIFTVIAAVLILGYIFFIKPKADEGNLVSSFSSSLGTGSLNTDALDNNATINNDFLSVLLNIQSLRLDDAIFSDKAFANLHDSSITLTPPGPNEKGRLNPFAPIGVEYSPGPTVPVVPPTQNTTVPPVPPKKS